MRRRKNRVYFRQASNRRSGVSLGRRSSSQDSSKIPVTRPRIPSMKPRTVVSSRAILHTTIKKSNFKVLTRAETLRKGLLVSSSVTGLLNMCMCVVGYYAVCVHDSEGDQGLGLLITVVLLAVAETALIVVYWSLILRITDARNAALSVEYMPNASLLKSPGALSLCILECVCHLLVPIPGLQLRTHTHIFSVDMEIDLNSYLYLSILIRNYHWLRVFCWSSRFSSIRTLIYTRLTTVSSNSGFFFRCSLAAYKFSLILLIYLAMMLTGGIIQATFEQASVIHSEESIWSGFWVVAYTQGSIGYGDSDSPITFQAQASSLANVLVGSILTGLLTTVSLNSISLSLKEFQYCSYLRGARYKQRHTAVAILVIQSWWRLIQSRVRQRPHGPIILNFYYTLRKFRSILVKCNTIESGLFKNQIEVVGEKISSSMRGMSEYLYAIKHIDELVVSKQTLDLVRAAYRIDLLSSKLGKSTKKHFSRSRSRPSLDLQTENSGRHTPSSTANFRGRTSESPRSMARAKNHAAQNVKGRLLRGKSFVRTTQDSEEYVARTST